MNNQSLPEISVRTLDKNNLDEIELVAHRMRLTLEEVLGETTGHSMYSLEWLIGRVRQHTHGELKGEVFVAETGTGSIAGHTIVRQDVDPNKNPIGLFSTIYVDPQHRRQFVASLLISRGEAWFLDLGLDRFATYTSETNEKLITLFQKHGYVISENFPDKKMVVIEKVR